MASSDTSRPLLELPGEVRKRIWERVFAHHVVDLPPAPGNLNGGLPHTLDPAAPAILLVCKQTHAEAIGVYYRLSDFRAPHDFPLRMYLRQLPVAYFHLVQNISIELGRAIPNRRLNVQFSTTYIANLAQRTVLLLQQYLRDVDHPSARDITVRSAPPMTQINRMTAWVRGSRKLSHSPASSSTTTGGHLRAGSPGGLG
ncbi:Hypothetical predicted protein [Lecanosticta acicola]|uniref:2EXR domain-containing protein n=1 Tax=Lecanosticta acicola TaxID=111012 RepID=A0AAI9EFY6_9PEZI|nr:Hypothetical predicted protein [Lecanosticta acicola]